MPEHDSESHDRPDDEAEIARQRARPLLAALTRRMPDALARSDVAVQLAIALTTNLELATSERELIVEAARIQEIGKVYVPVDLLRKRLVDLDRRQMAELAEHYEHGRALAAGAGLPKRTCSLILHTRERWDGDGPSGLTATEIPLGSRIIAVTREYVDAPLWSREAVGSDQALAVGIARLRSEAGASLDPELAELAAVLADPERAP